MIQFSHAIVRTPGGDCADGETTQTGAPAEPERLAEQHAAYRGALQAAGLQVTVLPALAGAPDAYFVEDPAVIVDELAILTRPGAISRRTEPEALEATLTPLRPVVRIQAPGTLDGGDVLIAGKHVFIGLSDRTNADGAGQLCALLERFDYTCEPLPLAAGLHLKSSINLAAPDTLIATEAFARMPAFAGFKHIVTPADEAFAANVLRINDTLLMAAGAPRTEAAARTALDVNIEVLDVSEVRKMDGGLTCMSLRMR